MSYQDDSVKYRVEGWSKNDVRLNQFLQKSLYFLFLFPVSLIQMKLQIANQIMYSLFQHVKFVGENGFYYVFNKSIPIGVH